MAYTEQTWVDNDPAHPVSAARMQHIEDGLAAVANGGSLPDGITVTHPGFADVTLTLSGAPTHGAGTQGLILNRSTMGNPVGLTLENAGVPIWDTIDLDFGTTDLVLAYDYNIPGDVLRLRQKTPNVSDGANVVIGPGIGQPSPAKRLDIYSPATDIYTTTMLALGVVSGSSVNTLVVGSVAGSTVLEVMATGKAGFGRGWSGIIAADAVEAEGHVMAHLVDADVFHVVQRTGTSTQTWLTGIEHSNSNQWVLKDNSSGLRPLVVRPGAADLSLYMDQSGNITMGVAASKLGFYGVPAVARAVLATGASHTVDDVITALQNIGLVKQS